MAKQLKLPFDRKGGVVAIQRRLLASPAYLELSPYAKAMIPLMQRFWTPNEPVGYGLKQARQEVPCSKPVAIRTFRELQEAGFIVMVDESVFNSRIGSKTRTWRLTWLPDTRHRYPSNEWENVK